MLAKGASLLGPQATRRKDERQMSRWNDTSDFHTAGRTSYGQAGPGREFFGRGSKGCRGADRWAERTCSYLKSRTADHWLMFAGGLLLGALLG